MGGRESVTLGQNKSCHLSVHEIVMEDTFPSVKDGKVIFVVVSLAGCAVCFVGKESIRLD